MSHRYGISVRFFFRQVTGQPKLNPVKRRHFFANSSFKCNEHLSMFFIQHIDLMKKH